MNMQDYRHAADRVEIADHCREEILDMKNQKERTTGAPLLRITAGLTAAAACLGIAGTVGYAMYRMKHEESSLAAASPVAEQTAMDYTGYFRDYYTQRNHGEPVDFDFASLTGTNFTETWELENYTVSLKAAVTDGWTLNYIYYVKVNNPSDMMDPFLQIYSDVPEDNGLPGRAGSQATSYVWRLDEQPDENGIIRFFGTSSCHYALPLPQGVPYHASCGGIQKDITVNLPETVPAMYPLTNPNDLSFQTLTLPLEQETGFTHGVVTPLGVVLANYPDRAEYIREVNDVGSRYLTAEQAPKIFTDDMISVECTDEESIAACSYSAVGAYCTYTAPMSDDADWSSCASCRMPFTVPQDFSGKNYLTLQSGGDPVRLEITSEPAPVIDMENIETVDDIECKPDPEVFHLGAGYYEALNNMDAAARTKTLPFGTVSLDDISYLENGLPSLGLTVTLNDTVTVGEDEMLALRFTPNAFGYEDEDKIRYEMQPEASKWVSVPAADIQDGICRCSLELDPLAPDSNGTPGCWEYVDIELELNEMCVRKQDDTADAASYEWTAAAEDDAVWNFNFGSSAYIPFDKLNEAQRTRSLADGGTVRIDSLEYEDGVPVLNYSVNLDDVTLPADDCWVFCQLLPIGTANNEIYMFPVDDEEHGSQIIAEATQDGWYHFRQRLVTQDGQYPADGELLLDVRLLLLIARDQNSNEQLSISTPSPNEEGGLYHIARFIIP